MSALWAGPCVRRSLDFAPLALAAGGRCHAEVARSLGVDHVRPERRHRYTCRRAQADVLATRLGLHPANVWPSWWAS
ncbi:MAG TPA: hypothetical protein VM262_19090 [Acidimicrobiales bacterium]|nr:hypothetical protein [Acidimicrobiales bacterium]